MVQENHGFCQRMQLKFWYSCHRKCMTRRLAWMVFLCHWNEFLVMKTWQRKSGYLNLLVAIWRVPKIGLPPKIILFNAIFPYKPSILGYTHILGNPYMDILSCRSNIYIYIYICIYVCVYIYNQPRGPEMVLCDRYIHGDLLRLNLLDTMGSHAIGSVPAMVADPQGNVDQWLLDFHWLWGNQTWISQGDNIQELVYPTYVFDDGPEKTVNKYKTIPEFNAG